jgi:type I restriction enzyme S subunit
VTRGLDPEAPVKPTGIEQIPEVPAGWEVRKVKEVATFNPSRAESSAAFTENDEVVFLPMENVSVTGDIDCGVRGKVRDLRNGYTYFKRGDVVVAKITPCFENGKGAFLGNLETEIGFGSTEFTVLRANAEIDPEFLYQVTMLRAFRRDGEMAMTGAAGQQRVSLDFLREFLFGRPPMEEQREILDFVKKESAKIRLTVERTNREIHLIQEYRERLVSDVVTGKLDVRSVDFGTVEDDMMLDDAEDLVEGEIEPDDADVMEEADAED